MGTGLLCAGMAYVCSTTGADFRRPAKQAMASTMHAV